MGALDIHDAGEIATAGKAEERSTQTRSFTHGCNPTAILLLCSDTISVPGVSRRSRLA